MHLINMNKSAEDSKRKCKDLEIELKELKVAKKQWEEDIKRKKTEEKQTGMILSEYKNENEKLKILCEKNQKQIEEQRQELVTKDAKIIGHKKINDELRDKINILVKAQEKLKDKESELQERVNVLQAVAGEIKDSESSVDQLVVIAKESKTDHNLETGKSKEIEELRKKLDESNKKNSLLKDSNEEKRSKLEAIDQFYKEILDQKDQTINGYTELISNETENNRNLKRLLIKFRSDYELKLIEELKHSIKLHGADSIEGEIPEQVLSVNDTVIEHKDNAEEGRMDDMIKQVQKVQNHENESDDKGKNVESDLENEKDHNKNQRRKICKFGRDCEHRDDPNECSFSHEVVNKPCRYGITCRKGETCLFLHDNIRKPIPQTTNSSRMYNQSDGKRDGRSNVFKMNGDYGNKINNGHCGEFDEGDRRTNICHDDSGRNMGNMNANTSRNDTSPARFEWSDGYGSHSALQIPNMISWSDPRVRNDFSQEMHENAWNGRRSAMQGEFPQRTDVKNLCKYGTTCNGANSWCNLNHNIIQKHCNAGDKSTRGNRCLFLHTSQEKKEKGEGSRKVLKIVEENDDAQWLIRNSAKNLLSRS